MRDAIIKMIYDIIESQVDMFIRDDQAPKDWDMSGLSQSMLEIIPFKLNLTEADIEKLSKSEFKQML